MRRTWTDVSRYARSADWLEGKSWHDAIWLVVPILAILLSGPVWFFRLVDLDMGRLTWSLFAFCVLREVANAWATRSKKDILILAVALAGDVVGIALLGLLWHYSKTIGNPLFLTVLLVPIIAGALMYTSVITFLLASLSIAASGIVAWLDIPQLRNAFLQSSFLPAWLASAISFSGKETSAATVGDYSAASTISILLAFSFGCVVVASIADRLCVHFVGVLQWSNNALTTVVEDYRPSMAVNRETLRITSANKSFRDFCIGSLGKQTRLALADGSTAAAEAQPVEEPALFESIQFEEEAEIRKLIAGRGGSTVCHYRLGVESRVGRVHVQIMEDLSQCQIALEDLSAELYLRTTLDSLDQGVILLAENKVVLYFNNAASRLFPALVSGVEAAAALKVEAVGSPWWELGDRSHHNRTIGINGRNYQTSCTAARLANQGMPINVISLSEAS